MVRVFGLLVAMAAMVTSANAALLGSYTFTGGSVAASGVDSTFASSGGSFSNFTAVTSGGAANVGSNSWHTGTISVNSGPVYDKFTVTVGANAPGLLIDKLVFKSNRVSGTGILATGTVDYSVNSGAYAEVGTFSWSSLGTFELPTALKLGPNDVIEFRFGFSMTSVPPAFPATNSVARLDDIELFGSSVPEPSSLAVFGSLAAFGAVRRFRRK